MLCSPKVESEGETVLPEPESPEEPMEEPQPEHSEQPEPEKDTEADVTGEEAENASEDVE